MGVTPTAGELTVLRTRGIFEAFINGPGATDGDGYFGAVGIGKVALPAFTAGIASMPTPITEVSWDGWLWHFFFSVHASDTSFAPGPVMHQREMIDSKAMRKFDGDEIFFAAIEVVEIGAANLNVFLDSRILVQDSSH